MGAVPFTVRPMFPLDLEIVTYQNEFTADLSWTNPTENTDGSALTSLSGVYIYRNDVLIADLPETVPGAAAQFTNTVPIQDSYRYKVIAYTEVSGIYAFTAEQWIGPPWYALPTGPDEYGYIALESVDIGGPAFDWIEIDPSAGGQGTPLNFVQDDQTFQVELPFTFKYYGLEYDQVSVCSNGWIAMGYTEETDYSNSVIPDADGPPAMLAPFWEDLSPQQSGSVSYFYDEVNNRFIIEFYRVRQYLPTTAIETFEAILYDPAHHPTATGDGKILFQWLDITDPTQATFGIENQAEAVGIQLGYNNYYDPTTIGICDNYSVLFLPPEENFPVTVTLTPESPSIVIPAGGGSFDYNVDLSSTAGNPETFDIWVEAVLPNGSIYGPILNRSLTLQPGGTLSREMTQQVPGGAPVGEYFYRCSIGYFDLGVIWCIDQFTFTKTGMDGSSSDSWKCWGFDNINENASVIGITPTKPCFHSIYPNPFNPETNICVNLPFAGDVSLVIYDVVGREITRLLEGWHPAGTYQATFNASDLPTGVYFARLKAEGFSQTRKLLLVK